MRHQGPRCLQGVGSWAVPGVGSILAVLAVSLPATAQDGAPVPPEANGTTAVAAPPTFAVPVVQLAPPAARAVREPTGLADIIRAKFPLAVQYRDMGLGWRELGYGAGTLYTKGETAWLTGEEYLVAYRYAPRLTTQFDATQYITAVTGNSNRIMPDDRFEIALVRMAELVPAVTTGGASLRSFDPARAGEPGRMNFPGRRRPSLDSANFSASFDQNLSLIYLRKIYEATSGFSSAYLNVMPPMESAFAARKALLPFAENAAIFTQPGTNQPYKTNPLFSNRKRAHLSGQSAAVIFYEAQPGPDGLRAVLSYNGAVRRVNEKQWTRLKKLSLLE